MKIMMYGCFNLMIILAMQQVADSQPRPELNLSLSVALGKDRSLDLKVTIHNVTEGSLLVDIPDRNPPFRISIWNEDGQDIYQLAYADEKKDGKSARPGSGQRIVTSNFQKGEIKEYNLTIANVYDAHGNTTSLSLGTYRLQVRLATVKYLNGNYQTELYQSNTAQIIIN